MVGGRHFDGGLGVAEGEVEDLREGGREGGVGGQEQMYFWEVGKNGCQNDGLDEADTMGREGGREGRREEGREDVPGR